MKMDERLDDEWELEREMERQQHHLCACASSPRHFVPASRQSDEMQVRHGRGSNRIVVHVISLLQERLEFIFLLFDKQGDHSTDEHWGDATKIITVDIAFDAV